MLDLAESERRFTASMNAPERAKRLAPKLRELAQEHRLRAKSTRNEAGKELHDLFAVYADDAAELLRILEQEQWRQREAIKLYLHGRIGISELRNISSGWNGERQPEGGGQ